MIADAETRTFPRSARVRTPEQFQATFSQGRRISAALFRLHVRFAGSDPVAAAAQLPGDAAKSFRTLPRAAPAVAATARLGIAVSKRVAAHAVERNRIKRVARDSFRQCRARLPHGDYVLLAQREAAGAPAAVLRETLLSLWQRASGLKPTVAPATMPMPTSDIDGPT